MPVLILLLISSCLCGTQHSKHYFNTEQVRLERGQILVFSQQQWRPVPRLYSDENGLFTFSSQAYKNLNKPPHYCTKCGKHFAGPKAYNHHGCVAKKTKKKNNQQAKPIPRTLKVPPIRPPRNPLLRRR